MQLMALPRLSTQFVLKLTMSAFWVARNFDSTSP